MLTPIILAYNKKYLNLESLYKINLYYIDNKYYIDMNEVEKFNKWSRKVFYKDWDHYDTCEDCIHECEHGYENCKLICKHQCDDKCNHLKDRTCEAFIDMNIIGEEDFKIKLWKTRHYDENERKENDELYIENESDHKHVYSDISIEDYLFNLVETSYRTFIDIFKLYKEHLEDLNDFKKPKNTFKQIISDSGEIIYVINLKKMIKNHYNIYSFYKNYKYYNCSGNYTIESDFMVHNFNIKIEIETLFDINKLYPLDLKKILTERKIKVSPYTDC